MPSDTPRDAVPAAASATSPAASPTTSQAASAGTSAAASTARRPVRTVVYTCVTNGYDLVLPPHDPVPGVDHIVFTDRPQDPVRGWQVRPIEVPAELGPALANRYYKLLPHKVLPDYDASVYLDANIRIKASLAPFLDEALGGSEDFAVYGHPSRTTVRDEVAACLAASRVRDPAALRAELDGYLAEGFPDAGTLTGNSILVRRHMQPDVIALMEAWWDLVAAKSGRDQVSLPYLRWKHGVAIREIRPHFSHSSPYFQRYPHWKNGGPRARLMIWLARNMDRGALFRAVHGIVGRSYGLAS